jgi:two-component system, NtrC family, nitrogen regulation sensor histidine kinase NtrY
MSRRFGIRARLWLLVTVVAALSVSTALAVLALSDDSWLARAAGVGAGAFVGGLLLDRLAAPALSLFRALAGTVTAYRDGDFAFDIAWDQDDELRELVDAHNRLGQTLRDQRLGLVQRELLLDTMVQNTPVAMVLASDGGRVAFGNLAARQLLNGGRPLEGAAVSAVIARQPEALADALRSGRDGLCTVPARRQPDGVTGGDAAARGQPGALEGVGGEPGGEGEADPALDVGDEVFHVACKDFALNGRAHRLLLVRPFTGELRRQEVRTWKKVIRVISHELNNSLAPIASMAFSGRELVRRGQPERLPEILAAIGERASHLEAFVRGYADVAKLPAPQLETVDWPAFVLRLGAQWPFRVEGSTPTPVLRADPAQLSLALINLLKNAHESGSAADAITVRASASHRAWRIEVADRGSGMSDTVLAQALLPFYSTKRDGSGLGLALVREIVDAHGGRITLAMRRHGGTRVTLVLPG